MAGLLGALAMGCTTSQSIGGGAALDAGVDPATAELTRARELCEPGTPMGDRPEIVALAQSVEGRARREAAGARAAELHGLAASLLERLWRIEGREQDAKEALDLYRAAAAAAAATAAASSEGAVAGCDATVRAAKLAGELGRDASISYAELYRAQRRFASVAAAAACSRAIDEQLASLSAFRPAPRVLEAIDDGLVGEGAIVPTSDAGAPVRVKVAPHVVRIEQWPGREAARVVLVLDRPAKFKVGDEAVGRGAPQTFIELEGVDVGTVPREIPVQGIITRIRTASTTTGARVVLELDGAAYRRDFYLPEPFRIVIDIARNRPDAAPPRGKRAVTRLVLDPGHGGSDPGAIGAGGLREKDVTLDIAHRVAPILARDGVQVVLTRDDDHFVSLEERTARANAFGADLFISIHCNAAVAESRGRRGVETYILDTSRDDIADRVAARENATSQAASKEVSSLLSNMRMVDQATRSSKLADLLQRAALASLKMAFPDAHDGGVHRAGFYVLVGARMPSVLFETSYISHATEEQRLGSDDYKQRLADGIVNAVKAYREGR